MNREEKSRQFECLIDAIAKKEAELAALHHERDVVAAWLQGWDARQGAEAGRTADSIPASGTIYDANPANSNPEPAQAQAEAGLTADSGSGSANVSEGVTAEREPAGETGGEAESHAELPDADDPPVKPTPIRPDLLGEFRAAVEHIAAIGNAGALFSELTAAGFEQTLLGRAVLAHHLTCQNTEGGIRYWIPKRAEAV